MSEIRLTIGLPVKNGENFLADALESLLSQTYGDFRLIISDNASTDATEEICRAFAGRDQRIEYKRHETDLGAAANYNYVYEQSASPLFTWAAHDDMRAPRYLEECIAALDSRPDCVLAFTGTLDVGPEGEPLEEWPLMKGFESDDPAIRLVDAFNQKETFPIFGVTRREAIDRTALHLPYAGSDRGMLAHLVMQGPFAQIEAPYFLHRQHTKRSVYSAKNRQERMAWWDPNSLDKLVIPHLLLTRDYWRAITGARLSARERRSCLRVLWGDVVKRRKALAADTLGALKHWLRRLVAK